MRLSEIRLLRREPVHLEQGVILLPRAEAGARQVILSAEAQEDPPRPSRLPRERVGVPRARRRALRSFLRRARLPQAAREAGIRDFHFHNLRHHGATMAPTRASRR